MLVQGSTKAFECPKDIEQSLHRIQSNVALALISYVRWRNAQPQSIVTASMFLSALTGIDTPTELSVGAYSSINGVATQSRIIGGYVRITGGNGGRMFIS